MKSLYKIKLRVVLYLSILHVGVCIGIFVYDLDTRHQDSTNIDKAEQQCVMRIKYASDERAVAVSETCMEILEDQKKDCDE